MLDNIITSNERTARNFFIQIIERDFIIEKKMIRISANFKSFLLLYCYQMTHKIQPFILVGIENTKRGRDLTGFSESEYDKQYCPITDGAKDFRAFIAEELIPTIHQKYRTTNRKGIIGESLAGLFVMETFFTSPNAFDFYIAMDPSLWWNNHYLAKNADSLLSNFPNQTIKLWFAGSNAKDISEFTQSVEKSLKANAPRQLSWKYSDEPKEKHHTIFRATKEKALIWTLNE